MHRNLLQPNSSQKATLTFTPHAQPSSSCRETHMRTRCTIPQTAVKASHSPTGVAEKKGIHSCVCSLQLTIPLQPVGCSPCQRPTPLPGRSAGKHRCSPMGNAAASECWMDEWLVWSGQSNVRGGGGQTCPLLRNIGCALRGMKGDECHRAGG